MPPVVVAIVSAIAVVSTVCGVALGVTAIVDLATGKEQCAMPWIDYADRCGYNGTPVKLWCPVDASRTDECSHISPEKSTIHVVVTVVLVVVPVLLSVACLVSLLAQNRAGQPSHSLVPVRDPDLVSEA